MAGFLYFKPNYAQLVTPKQVTDWGLGYAFTSGPSGTQCNIHTPTGGSGVVFGDTKRLGDWQPVMDMENQEWRKIPKSDCYVGYWKEARPTPEDLERPNILPGYKMQVGDYEWTVPLTARFDEKRRALVTTLPCYIDCNDDGEWIESDVLAVHEHLWEMGRIFRDDVMRRLVDDAAPIDFTLDQLRNAAVGYLQANYVVGQRELTMMRGLTNESTIHAAILAANDLPTFWEWDQQQKKSASLATAEDLTTANGEVA